VTSVVFPHDYYRFHVDFDEADFVAKKVLGNVAGSKATRPVEQHYPVSPQQIVSLAMAYETLRKQTQSHTNKEKKDHAKATSTRTRGISRDSSRVVVLGADEFLRRLQRDSVHG
jgi:hypothetical protein